MKRINILFLALVAIFAVSCGDPEPPTLTPKSTTLRGDLSKYFKVVDKPVKLEVNEYFKSSVIIKVELEKIAELPYDKSTTYPVGTSGNGVDRNIGFGLKVFDAEDGIALQVAATATGVSGVYSNDDIKNLITMEVGEVGYVRWGENISVEEQSALSTFEISSALVQNKQTSAPSASSASAKWNNFLDKYESYVDQYIKLIQRADEGDDSAEDRAMSMLEQIESLCEDLDDAESEMSTAQMSRLMKINTKISDATSIF